MEFYLRYKIQNLAFFFHPLKAIIIPKLHPKSYPGSYLTRFWTTLEANLFFVQNSSNLSKKIIIK